MFQPKTIQSKNSLMEIGSNNSKSESSNYGNFQLSKSDTMKGIQPIEDETMSTAPTVLIGFEQEERLLEVRPASHIPGKRRAPKPPPPQVPIETNVCFAIAFYFLKTSIFFFGFFLVLYNLNLRIQKNIVSC